MFGESMTNAPRRTHSSSFQMDAVLKSQPPGYRHAVTSYEQFYLIVVLDGELLYTDPTNEASVMPGRMAVLRPGTDFVLYTETQGYSGVAVEVRPANQAGAEAVSAITQPSARIRTVGGWLREELALPRSRSADTVLHLAALLLEIANQQGSLFPPGEPHQARSAHWARRAREAIENSIYTTENVQAVLQRFPVSYRQLTRYLVAECGAAPKEIQIAARIQEAKRLLQETGWSVATIALELGFSSAQHLTAVFSEREGISPARWRGANP